MNTFGDLMRAIMLILPDAELGEDNDGQIVIYTGKKLLKDERIVDFDSEITTFEVN